MGKPRRENEADTDSAAPRGGYSLMLGAALGNRIDRLARGYVVDYLDLLLA
ncbi:signal peptidase II [Aquisalimonas lutea]|uniref:signal peptidase II n=1 Tax=Aquisalimonas lutea TaxID=1327750 RepID=UPI003F496E1B